MVVPEEKGTFLISAQFFSLFHSACIHAHMRARTHTHTPYSVALFVLSLYKSRVLVEMRQHSSMIGVRSKELDCWV